MAFDRALLNNFAYFHRFGTQIDVTFLQDVLLPGLARAFPSGIELPHGTAEPAEYLSLRDAAALVIDWLAEHNAIGESEVRSLTSLTGKSSFRELATALQLILENRISDPQKLLTSRLAANVAELKDVQALAQARKGAEYNPAGDLVAYNRLYQKIRALAAQGIPRELIPQLVPKGLTDLSGTLTRERLIDLIVSHLPELVTAAHEQVADVDKDDPFIAASAITKKLKNIIQEDAPDFAGYLNFIHMEEVELGLYQLTTALEKESIKAGISLADYAEIKLKAAQSLPYLLPAQHEITSLVTSIIPLGTGGEKERAARAVSAALVSSYGKKLTASEIIAVVGQELNLSPDTLRRIATSLHNSGLDSVLEYHQHSLSLDLNSQPLTRSARNLAKKGVNPFYAHFKPSDLLFEARQFLATPSGPLTLQEAQNRIQQAYDQEGAKDSPNRVELMRLKHWLDRHSTVDFLNQKENESLNRLATRSRRERWVYNANYRLRNAQTTFFNKWIELEEKLPWNRFARKAFEKIDYIAEGGGIKLLGQIRRPGIITLPLGRGKKLEIPYLRLGSWIYGGVQGLKRNITLRTYILVNRGNWGVFRPAQRFLKFSLRSYSIGGYNSQMAIYHVQQRAWGRLLSASASIFKYSTVKPLALAGERTATRLLLKLGGKALVRLGGGALVKIGGKIAAALIAAGTLVGTIISVASIISIAVDLLKLGYNFVKEFIENANFREWIIKIGAVGSIVGGFIITLPTLIITGLGIAFAAALPILIAAVLWTVGLTAFGEVYHRMSKFAADIDPGLGLFQAIFCSQDEAGANVGEGAQPSGDPVVACATCLVEYLEACYQNPITGNKISAQGLGCLLAQAIAPDVAEAIRASAVYYNYLQCIGFARAAAICGGGDLDGRAVASDYIQNPAAGYDFISGAGSCAPGDLGLIDGAIGHIFVVGSNNNATLTAIDANFVCNGCVSANNPIPASSVAGCMKRN